MTTTKSLCKFGNKVCHHCRWCDLSPPSLFDNSSPAIKAWSTHSSLSSLPLRLLCWLCFTASSYIPFGQTTYVVELPSSPRHQSLNCQNSVLQGYLPMKTERNISVWWENEIHTDIIWNCTEMTIEYFEEISWQCLQLTTNSFQQWFRLSCSTLSFYTLYTYRVHFFFPLLWQWPLWHRLQDV